MSADGAERNRSMATEARPASALRLTNGLVSQSVSVELLGLIADFRVVIVFALANYAIKELSQKFCRSTLKVLREQAFKGVLKERQAFKGILKERQAFKGIVKERQAFKIYI
jgi:hypothetical protein